MQPCSPPLQTPSPSSPSMRQYNSGTPPYQHSPTPPQYSPITPLPAQSVQHPAIVDLTEDSNVLVALQRSIDDLQPERETQVKELGDIVLELRKRSGITIPDVTSEEWDNIPRTSIDVRRDFVVPDGIREARKKRYDTSKLLKVSFVSEAGVDTGGPMREFYRLFAKGVSESYCISNENGQFFPVKNILTLQSQDYKNIGKITAMSIVQGGSGMLIFHSSVYKYVCSGTCLGLVDDDDAVPDTQVRILLNEIREADTDDALRHIFEDNGNAALVYETGYTKPLCLVKIADRDGLRGALRDYHSLVKIKAELDQFSEGLHTCDVLMYIQKYPELMSPLFCTQASKLSKDYFKQFTCIFSSHDPRRKAKEEITYIFFMDFLEECEEGTCLTENDNKVTLEDILIFCTGTDREPPLGFQPKPTLCFTDSTLATSSTCTLRLRLPCEHATYEVFKSKLILSLRGNDGLGMA